MSSQAIRKEEIRRLKCKVLILADQLKPKLTGHIRYLKDRYDKVDIRLADKDGRRLEREARLIKEGINEFNSKLKGTVNKASHSSTKILDKEK